MAFGSAAGYGNLPNGNFSPIIYSKQVQLAFRKSSIVDAITNNDYFGEIANMGDSVKVIKEPEITVKAYSRGTTITPQDLDDEEFSLNIDKANYFSFAIDSLEKRFSHINFADIASNNAAYKLKDTMDAEVLEHMYTDSIGSGSQADSLTPIATSGGVAASQAIFGSVAAPIDIGHASGEVDPLNQMALAAKVLDEANAPEDGRWFVAAPEWYNQLSNSASKLLSVDFNAGQGSIRNGLVSSGKLRGFDMYKSNNIAATSNATGKVMAGHMSSTATANTILSTEVLRDPTSFGDIVRGLHVYGAKVLRPEALVSAFYVID